MSIDKIKLNKLAGKTSYSGRRRPSTKKSGYKSHTDATGGKFTRVDTHKYKLLKNEILNLKFILPLDKKAKFLGFGIYFKVDNKYTFRDDFNEKGDRIFNENIFPNWSKFGSIWKPKAESLIPYEVNIEIEAIEDCEVNIYKPQCGTVWHSYFNESRDSVLKNLAIFSPEGLFFTNEGTVSINAPKPPMVDLNSLFLRTYLVFSLICNSQNLDHEMICAV